MLDDKPFKLSASLVGHSLDVRCVTTTKDNLIFSGSRDKTAKQWRPNGFNTGYNLGKSYESQKNFVSAVLYLNPTNDYPEGVVVTGGNDHCILLYLPNEREAFATYKEHSDVVCALQHGLEPNSFVSGSWDKSAKLWHAQSEKATITFSGHAAAVWGALQLSDGQFATASADRTIGLWTREGQQVHSLTGHKDCVRALADFPKFSRFVSAANDASIKLWSYKGECLATYYGHTNYIYCIARDDSIGDGTMRFVCGDEDRTVRYWRDGVNTQTVALPAQSVWSVACMSNGDIVTGTSDGVVRVFTRHDERYAGEEVLHMYDGEVDALARQNTQEIGGVKVSDLPGKEALYEPGKRAGQMKMIREPNGVVAYTWIEEGEGGHWDKIGEVLGGSDESAAGKTKYQGQSYDYVFSVDVEDGKPPLKLPYNKGDDPYKAAHKFLSDNFLPASYLEQVVEFILKNSSSQDQPMSTSNDFVDPFTGATRYMPESSTQGAGLDGTTAAGANADPLTGGGSYTTSTKPTWTPNAAAPSSAFAGNADPFTGGSSYTTSTLKNSSSSSSSSQVEEYYPHLSYLRFDMGDTGIILRKIKEFNDKQMPGSMISDVDLMMIANLCTSSCSDSAAIDVLFNCLKGWTSETLFPLIDIIRLAMRHEVNSSLICTKNDGEIVLLLMKQLLPNSYANNVLVSVRALVNMFQCQIGMELLGGSATEILKVASTNTSFNKNIETALATLYLNMTILILSSSKQTNVNELVINDVCDIFGKSGDAECLFRCLVTLGTLLRKSAEDLEVIRGKLSGEHFDKLKRLIADTTTDAESKLKKCATKICTELNL